jgi:hypothetical protein
MSQPSEGLPIGYGLGEPVISGSRSELIAYFIANPTHPLVQAQIDRVREADPWAPISLETTLWAIGQAALRESNL